MLAGTAGGTPAELVLERMIAKLAEVTKRRWVCAESLKPETPWAREYGLVLLLRRLWRELGLDQVLDGLQRGAPSRRR